MQSERNGEVASLAAAGAFHFPHPAYFAFLGFILTLDLTLSSLLHFQKNYTLSDIHGYNFLEMIVVRRAKQILGCGKWNAPAAARPAIFCPYNLYSLPELSKIGGLFTLIENIVNIYAFVKVLIMNSTDNTTKKETYIKCKKCGTKIYWNTHKKLTSCKCGAIFVDGCEEYTRIGGSEKDYEYFQK